MCYQCRSAGNWSDELRKPLFHHADCMEGGENVTTCNGTYCVAYLGQETSGELGMMRHCAQEQPECIADDGWECGCDTDLCNDWNSTNLMAMALPPSTSSSVSYLMAISLVGAKMINHF
ncbi:unnamed protein product, partial [Mesorhabditis spiculigera]